jgi:hypothetical protein
MATIAKEIGMETAVVIMIGNEYVVKNILIISLLLYPSVHKVAIFFLFESINNEETTTANIIDNNIDINWIINIKYDESIEIFLNVYSLILFQFIVSKTPTKGVALYLDIKDVVLSTFVLVLSHKFGSLITFSSQVCHFPLTTSVGK